MHVSVLPAAVARGAEIFAGARVSDILVENGRARGVVARLHDPGSGAPRGTLRVRARAVVLAAGAVYTPALLLRRRLAVGSAQVGRHLVVHPGVGTTAEFAEDLHAWRGVMQGYHCDQFIREGVLLESTFPPPGLGYSAASLPGVGAELVERIARFPHMAACGSVISDHGSGRVRLLPGLGATMRYDLAAADVRRVLLGISAACEIYLAAGARRVYAMLPGLEEVTTVAQARAIRDGRWRAAELKLSAYHPMGTCRMGVDPRSSVVDADGQTHDVPGLWILDASVLPSSTVVNPQVTIMAMAMRGARRLAARIA
jgi:choline dehydrogenase-like flavoprotein